MVPSGVVKLWVGVTDGDWFDFLRTRPDLTEVNFWQPGGQSVFKTIQPGELFLFKLHSPRNYIVGGGIFAHVSRPLPVSLAWEAFGEANGASSLDAMRSRIRKYRKGSPKEKFDFPIGCRLLSQPFFFPEDRWIPVPASWKPNIVQGKTFSTSSPEGLKLWEDVQNRLQGIQRLGVAEREPRYGTPTLIPPRLGQGGFRLMVTDAYERTCALTGERVLPALEASHIRPYGKGGEHVVSNGLLLRRDFHSLFDRGYITVTPEYRVEVSRRIKEEFVNGRRYYEIHGELLRLPVSSADKPRPDVLSWHNENVYVG